ncbi:hypothetical protein [Plantibacter sp. M259]|uniref:hypothetical protein n=1 Tax=Plantibacter sp. M259 TaxID=2583822 RepID=UPI00197C5A66|nr:hypothetical protein [Plantibacter sp. M259]
MTTIDDAINDRVEIEFTYDGLPRVVQPAAHGTHVSTGKELLRGYQTGGTSATRSVPLWDLFSVAKIESLVVTERRFDANPPGYSPDDRHLGEIYAQL